MHTWVRLGHRLAVLLYRLDFGLPAAGRKDHVHARLQHAGQDAAHAHRPHPADLEHILQTGAAIPA